MWRLLSSCLLFVLCLDLQAQNPLPDLEIFVSVPEPASLGTYGVQSQPMHPSLAQSNYFNNFNALSSNERHQQLIAEVDQHIASNSGHKARVQTLLDDAHTTILETKVNYSLRGRNISGREIFQAALSELNSMLKGDRPLNIKKAVFLSEYAYDPTLNWQDFEKSIDDMIAHLGYYMQDHGFDKNDNSAKNMAIYNFFTDTITVAHEGKEQPVTSYPLFYDFDDFWGRADNSKMFVSKLIKDGTGQCHSLPLLYLILAEEMNAEAHLAFAPNHSYIKIQDKLGDWHNIELTNHTLTSDQFIMQTGFVKSAAIANRIYMNPLAKKEVVAQSVNDLMMNYIRKFGYEDFILEGTAVAHQYGGNSISAHLLNHNYYQTLFQYIVNQYKKKGLTQKQLNQDQKAVYVYKQMMGSRQLIDNLGYADMPAEMYEDWLRSVEDEGRKQEHRNKMRTLMGQIGNK